MEYVCLRSEEDQPLRVPCSLFTWLSYHFEMEVVRHLQVLFTCNRELHVVKLGGIQVVPKVNSCYLYNICNVVKGGLGRARVSRNVDGVWFLRS